MDFQTLVRDQSPETTTGRLATVTQASPLRVKIDGDSAALGFTPDTLVAGLAVSDRVFVQIVNRRLVVMGKFGGLPTGSVTSSMITDATIATGDLANDAVTNAKLANMATQTFKGRTTASTGDPEDLTLTQARELIQQPAYAFIRFTPAGAINSTAVTYTDITNAVCAITKRHGTASNLLIRAEGTWFFTVSTAGAYIALRVNSVDNVVVNSPFTVPAAQRIAFAGSTVVTGLAAGSYTVQARWRSQTAGAGNAPQMNANDDYIMITAMEVWS